MVVWLDMVVWQMKFHYLIWIYLGKIDNDLTATEPWNHG